MKKIICIFLVIGFCLGMYYWWCASKVTQIVQNVPEIAVVERGDLRTVVESIGSVEPEREVEIKCEASGEVIKLPVDVSDRVKKGELLVQLDPQDQERLVQQAEVAVDVSQAKLEQAKLALKIAKLSLANEQTRTEAALTSAKILAQEAVVRLKRNEQLHEKKIISKEDLEETHITHAKTVESLESAKVSIQDLAIQELRITSLQQGIRIAEQEVVTNRLELDDAKKQLRETTVSSPIDGVVTVRDVQVGQIISSGTSNVSGGTTVLYLADTSRMYVSVSVDESDIGCICAGQTVRITVDAFPESEFHGKVVHIGSKGISTSNVVTFKVKVEVTSMNKHRLKTGMTANVEITTIDRKDILRVPSEAVHRTSGKCFVTIVKDDNATDEQLVSIGDTGGDWVEVLGGLKEGVRLLVTPRQRSQWRNDETQQKQNAQQLSSNMFGMGGPSQ
jgi:multidrug efflux pump subunit AcrA (membrane-fusion protein)